MLIDDYCQTGLVFGELYVCSTYTGFFDTDGRIIHDVGMIMPVCECQCILVGGHGPNLFTHFLDSRGRIITKANWEICNQLLNFKIIRDSK